MLFIYKRDTFATQKTNVMCTLKTAYSRFADLVLDGRNLPPAGGEYSGICKSIGARPAALDRILERELGMNGPEILDCMQKLLNL